MWEKLRKIKKNNYMNKVLVILGEELVFITKIWLNI